MILILAIIAGVICLDQLTKWLAVIYLQGEASFPLWKDVLHFTYSENTGMAFGMMKDQRWVFMVLSTVAIVGLLVYLFIFRPKSRWMQVAMAMIVGGGIGNMIDRIALGYVVDFIDFTLIDFAIFNVADSFVCVGAGILIVYLLADILEDAKKEKKLAAEQAVAEESAEEVGEEVGEESAKTSAEETDHDE